MNSDTSIETSEDEARPYRRDPDMDGMATPRGPIDANDLERIAKERPNESFLKGTGVLKLTGAIRDLEAQLRQANAKVATALGALKFYADGSHFSLADPDAWDTVSGEPANFQCDEAGTATVEDGSIAKMALEELTGENTAYSEMMALERETDAQSQQEAA